MFLLRWFVFFFLGHVSVLFDRVVELGFWRRFGGFCGGSFVWFWSLLGFRVGLEAVFWVVLRQFWMVLLGWFLECLFVCLFVGAAVLWGFVRWFYGF